MSVKEVLSDNRTQAYPFPASTAIAVGDLLFWDSSAHVANAAGNRADKGSLILNQADFRANFLGVAAEQRLSTETSTGDDSRRLVVQDGIFDVTCASGTWEVGDLVAIDRSGTPANYNQQVAKVSNPALAIGHCVRRQTSNVTTVRCRLTSSLMYSDWVMANQGIGGFQGQSSAVFPDADTTLTQASAPIQAGVPTAARKCILPPPAQSAGMMFFIVNNSAGAFAINIRDNGDTTTIQSVAQNKRAICWCDGTTWFGLLGA